MKRAGGRLRWLRVGALLLLAACEAAEGVDVQPLPPLDPPSVERRAGLPEMQGVWRFAGWEVPLRDTVAGRAGLPAPGEIRVTTQRLDSLAGSYVREGAAFPFVGEARRDSLFSVVVFGPDGVGSFVAGRVRSDTLWVELTSLPSAQPWPTGTRAAFVRSRVGEPFVRFPGLAPPPPPPDTTRADTLPADTAAAAPRQPAAPGTTPPATRPEARPQPTRPAPTPPPAQPTPREPAPERPPPTRDTVRRQPRPAPQQPRPRPPADTQRRETPPRPELQPVVPEPVPDTLTPPPTPPRR